MRERELDRFAQGYISEAEVIAFIEKQFTTSSCCVLLKEGTAVRIIAPRVDDGFATQVLPLTGDKSEARLGHENPPLGQLMLSETHERGGSGAVQPGQGVSLDRWPRFEGNQQIIEDRNHFWR